MPAGAASTACWSGNTTASRARLAHWSRHCRNSATSAWTSSVTPRPMGRLFFHVIGSFAEFEREVIVERVRAGLANARAKGKRLGRPVRDPDAQARVVALKGEGLSLRQIAARERLSPSGVRKMLRRAGVETAAASALVPVSG